MALQTLQNLNDVSNQALRAKSNHILGTCSFLPGLSIPHALPFNPPFTLIHYQELQKAIQPVLTRVNNMQRFTGIDEPKSRQSMVFSILLKKYSLVIDSELENSPLEFHIQDLYRNADNISVNENVFEVDTCHAKEFAEVNVQTNEEFEKFRDQVLNPAVESFFGLSEDIELEMDAFQIVDVRNNGKLIPDNKNQGIHRLSEDKQKRRLGYVLLDLNQVLVDRPLRVSKKDSTSSKETQEIPFINLNSDFNSSAKFRPFAANNQIHFTHRSRNVNLNEDQTNATTDTVDNKHGIGPIYIASASTSYAICNKENTEQKGRDYVAVLRFQVYAKAKDWKQQLAKNLAEKVFITWPMSFGIVGDFHARMGRDGDIIRRALELRLTKLKSHIPSNSSSSSTLQNENEGCVEDSEVLLEYDVGISKETSADNYLEISVLKLPKKPTVSFLSTKNKKLITPIPFLPLDTTNTGIILTKEYGSDDEVDYEHYLSFTDSYTLRAPNSLSEEKFLSENVTEAVRREVQEAAYCAARLAEQEFSVSVHANDEEDNDKETNKKKRKHEDGDSTMDNNKDKEEDEEDENDEIENEMTNKESSGTFDDAE